jgi:hypothetical protein
LAIKLGGIELATPGDVIVGGTAYGVVFAIDAFFFSGGATSAQSAGAAAAAALGVKYGVQKYIARRNAKRLEDKSSSSDDEPKT